MILLQILCRHSSSDQLRINNYSNKEPFFLESGGVLPYIDVAYSTYGQLNKDKSNVVVVCHALTANSLVHDWWNGLFGKDNVFDPEQDFIICINNLGSPYGTSSPKSIDPSSNKSYGINFPFYTIRDTARLQIKFLEQLGIHSIKMLIGGSCGGNIAQEIALMKGDQVENLVLLCCSAKETPWVIAIHESQRIALEADPTFRTVEDGGQNGLRGARAFALPFYRSHPSFKLRQAEEDLTKVSDFKAASYIKYQGDKFVNRYDPYCYYHQLNALDTHNIGRDRETIKDALSAISAKTLCIGFDTDLLIPISEQKYLADHIPDGQYAEIHTIFGHDAFLIETHTIKDLVLTHFV